VIAILLFGLGFVVTGQAPTMPATLWEASLFERILWVNVAILAFNLIPAFPMDGGRALRAVLATRLTYVRATRAAAGLGRAYAVLFGLLGLMTNPFLILIAVFVWIGAVAEQGAVELKSALHGTPAEQAMLTDYRTLDASDTLATAVDLTLAGSQKDFPVLDRGALVGVLGQSALVAALSRGAVDLSVADVMGRAPACADRREPLGPILERLQSEPAQLVPVSNSRGELVGIITSDNVLELLRFRSAMENNQAAGQPGVLRSARAT
jgi:predicted transcriptional regulator